MDIITIPIEGNQYILEVSKKKRFYSLTEFGQYLITIRFKNYINQTVLEIQTTEKEYFNMIQSMNYFCCNYGSTYSDIIHLDSSILPYYIHIYNIDKNIQEYPTEEEEPWCGISIYQGNENNQGSINRLYLESSYYNLENILYELFRLIEEIPYLQEINSSFLNDIFDNYMDAESYQRYVYNMID